MRISNVKSVLVACTAIMLGADALAISIPSSNLKFTLQRDSKETPVSTVEISRFNSWDEAAIVRIRTLDGKETSLQFPKTCDGYKYAIDLMSFMSGGQKIILPPNSGQTVLAADICRVQVLHSNGKKISVCMRKDEAARDAVEAADKTQGEN